MLPKLFRTYKNRQFTFMPRFYNQQKEELEERIKQIEKEVQGEKSEGYSGNIMRGSFRRAYQRRSSANRYSLLRIVIIIAILLALVYFLFTL